MPRHGPGWRAVGVHSAAMAGILLFIIALAPGRPDVALLGVPALLAALFSQTKPPTRPQTVAELPTAPEAAGSIESTLQITGGEFAQVRASAAGHRPVEAIVAVPKSGERTIRLRLASVRTGPQVTAVADVLGHEGVWQQDLRSAGGSGRLVLPTSMRLGHVPVPRRLRGLTGPRPSRRFGEGGELRDVHPFAPGDRLKRIDWRTTARRSPNLDTLYVRRSFADAEGVVMLVVDSRDDVGPDLRTWRGFSEQRVDEATSLDLARHAAASVARALVETGDRVGLVDLGLQARPLPPASGRRHLRRVLHGLALARPVGPPRPAVRPPQVPADALVYLFSTVLDQAAVQLTRTWRSLGHPVVLVDTLPEVRPVTEPHLAIAWRILRMERQQRLDELAREGVPIVSWAGSSRQDAAAVLDSIAKAAARQRDWR
ncbi:MAG: DUF58 domain-containing protein [Propionibacteriaceae bacterium]|nr:DUF58 domain-containing protein [Propionibacteriaceae bacterium]